MLLAAVLVDINGLVTGWLLPVLPATALSHRSVTCIHLDISGTFKLVTLLSKSHQKVLYTKPIFIEIYPETIDNVWLI
jgi:hypothetical protein